MSSVILILRYLKLFDMAKGKLLHVFFCFFASKLMLFERLILYPEIVPNADNSVITFGRGEDGSETYSSRSSAYNETLCSVPALSVVRGA